MVRIRQLYEITRKSLTHLGAFLVDDVGDTDGVHYVPVVVTDDYPGRPADDSERRRAWAR